MEEKILKDLSVNIIKWYEFKMNSRIMYIGKNGDIVEYLNENNKVTSIISIDEINDSEFYDYIIIDIQKVNIYDIEKLKQKINEDGILIFLLNNKYGITNFVTYNYKEQISPLEENKEYANIEEIVTYLKNIKFFINRYMIYPNKEKVDMIIREDFNEISDKLDKYFYDYPKDDIAICKESDLLKNILKYDKELFKKMANSYIIEASLKNLQNEIKYISFNNYRKDEYRLITKIKNDIVQKQEENEEAKKHIEEIAQNIKKLEKYNFKILDRYENDVLFSHLIKNKETLDIDLAKNSNNMQYIVDILSKIKEELLKHSVRYDSIDNKETIKKYLSIDEEILKELNYIEYAFYDMVPKNCFYINKEFYFFDQEWMEKYLPVEFIIYRSVINCYDLVKKINVDELFERLEILKYKKIFEETDNKIREKIIDFDRLKICNKEYKKMYEIIYENKVLKQENENQRNLINAYKANNIKQDEYIKYLEKEIEISKEKNKKKNFF